VLARDAPQIPFDVYGMPDKIKADALGLNPHVVDANIHSNNGCETNTKPIEFPQNFRRMARA
jgi:hypothetical protein